MWWHWSWINKRSTIGNRKREKEWKKARAGEGKSVGAGEREGKGVGVFLQTGLKIILGAKTSSEIVREVKPWDGSEILEEEGSSSGDEVSEVVLIWL